jgi:hypothetical protein
MILNSRGTFLLKMIAQVPFCCSVSRRSKSGAAVEKKNEAFASRESPPLKMPTFLPSVP